MNETRVIRTALHKIESIPEFTARSSIGNKIHEPLCKTCILSNSSDMHIFA